MISHDPTFTTDMAVTAPTRPSTLTYTVWAYHLTGGKWGKSDPYSWTTTDPVQGWQYTKDVNAVPGWYATNNCAPIVPESQRYYEGGLVHGSPVNNYYYDTDGAVSWTYYYYTYHYHHHHHH